MQCRNAATCEHKIGVLQIQDKRSYKGVHEFKEILSTVTRKEMSQRVRRTFRGSQFCIINSKETKI
jgi:hypothetical protein